MQNSYLEIFDNLFFHVEKNDNVKETIEQASYLLDSLITRFGKVLKKIGPSKYYFVDTVIILFIRKIMEQLDAINVLYSVCLFDPAQIILRSLIETIVGLEFILKDDTKERAAAYYLDHHYQDLDKGNYLNENTEEGKRFSEQMGKDAFDKCFEKLEKKKQALEQLIAKNIVFQDIHKKREIKIKAKRKKNKKVNIKWYEVCSNITSIYGLMKETGYENYYDPIYGGLSFETHGYNATMGMTVNENGSDLKYIRNPIGGRSTFELTCKFSIQALEKIYQYLGDGESEIAEFKVYSKDFEEKLNLAAHYLNMIVL